MRRSLPYLSLPVVALWCVNALFASPDSPERKPPSVYIAKGACPFEGCVYRDWIARRALTVYDRPNGAGIVDKVRKGERVHAITGEVHCRPVRVVARRDHPEPGSYEPTSPRIRKGQVYYLLHHLGEGTWQVWFRGAVTVVEGLEPNVQPPRTTWWAKVKTPRGKTGWVIATSSFDGQDMLAEVRPESKGSRTSFAVITRKTEKLARIGEALCRLGC